MRSPFPATLDEFANLADDLPWTFAKTMADTPHSYVVRGKALDHDTFNDAVRIIRRHGVPGKFYRRTLIYLTMDGYRYWTMGAPIDETIIINRTDDPTWYGVQDAPDTTSLDRNVYDRLAPDYDNRYDTPTCHAENEQVRDLIVAHVGQRPTSVLDVGAGTGLVLDLKICRPRDYTAVDPSQAMLNELVRKHPTAKRVRAVPFTETLDVEPHTLTLSLFGSPSYLTPDAIAKLPQIGTQGVLMFYVDGYWPDYYDQEPPTAAPARQAAYDLVDRQPGAAATTIGNFLTVTW